MSGRLAISEMQDNPGCNGSYQSHYKADVELVLVLLGIRDSPQVSPRVSVRSWEHENDESKRWHSRLPKS